MNHGKVVFFDMQCGVLFVYWIDSLLVFVQCEVNFLGRVSHPNLVKLLGYCLEGEELLLVYEYMQKGSLENHLFRSKNLL